MTRETLSHTHEADAQTNDALTYTSGKAGIEGLDIKPFWEPSEIDVQSFQNRLSKGPKAEAV